ncbi:MAG: nucleotide exchange factor GrpE [Alphaproteobacteria bacterium]|nr:nucleotide exchange factor GrpE [Alphaproteobacteria bacterium]
MTTQEPEPILPIDNEPPLPVGEAENVVDVRDAKISALESALKAEKDNALRTLAEADNIRKRALKDREDAVKFAITSFAKDLLDFSDNFHRGLSAIPDELKKSDPRFANVMDGISAMERELLKTFSKHGIQKIEPLDQPFDPNFHEVLFETPLPGKPGGLVIQVVEAGYVLNGRLLRAAKVGISKGDPLSGDKLVDQKA